MKVSSPHWVKFVLPVIVGFVFHASSVVAFQEEAQKIPAAKLQFDLPKQTINKLEKVVLPALQAKDMPRFLESFGSIIQKADPEQFDEIERYGFNNGVASIRKAFGDAVMQNVERGTPPRFSRFQLPAVQYLNQYFIERVNTDLGELRMHTVMEEPLALPDTWDEREKLFWEVHVWQNRLDNLYRLTSFYIGLNENHYRRAVRQDDTEVLEALQPVSELPEKLFSAAMQMNENQAELRLIELHDAVNTLHEEKDFAIRLAAAFALELDVGQLQDFMETVDWTMVTRRRLTDPRFPDTVKLLAKTGREYGKDVIEKAILLRTGAHWWLRGRYGMGPMVYGLMKAPEATKNEEAMFGLYMPKARPKPVNWVSDDGTISPGYERRHYYTWLVEYREMVMSGHNESESESTYGPTDTKLTGTVFW